MDDANDQSNTQWIFTNVFLCLVVLGFSAQVWAGDSLFPGLDEVGDKYTFVLIADPQVGTDRPGDPRPPSRNLSRTVDEINQMKPAPAFVLFNGDLVGKGSNESHTANFVNRAGKLEPLTILVHGNHDGRPPYMEFQRMQFQLNRTRAINFSFDCGRWHFVAFPSNINTPELEQEYLTWLDNDLKANKDKPTMVFVHYHLLPQGLTQLEWYTYDKPYRNQVVDTITRYGNVKYCFFGHVHNGIKAAVKTAWEYKGTKWITAPTGTAPRNFGEEYPGFESGQDDGTDPGGGYYLVIDIDGKDATIKGRLNNVDKEYIFRADTFREYKDEEPLWFKNVLDYPANENLVNGGFEGDLAGWMRPYRYLSDSEPGFIWRADSDIKKAGDKSAYLFVREKGQPWAREEMMELYQLVQVKNQTPVFSAQFYPEKFTGGGGYVRLCAYSGRDMKFLMLFDFGNGDKPDNMRMATNSIYTATGQKGSPGELIKMGREKTAMFLELDVAAGKWHDLAVDIAEFYDFTHRSGPKFAELGIDKMLVAVGVWCQRHKGSLSGAYFDEISISPRTGQDQAAIFDGEPVRLTAGIFKTTFGASRYEPDQKRPRKK